MEKKKRLSQWPSRASSLIQRQLEDYNYKCIADAKFLYDFGWPSPKHARELRKAISEIASEVKADIEIYNKLGISSLRGTDLHELRDRYMCLLRTSIILRVATIYGPFARHRKLLWIKQIEAMQKLGLMQEDTIFNNK
jgi:hypothetical protein